MHERLGKYELLRHLASGGMAKVYLARVSGMAGFERHVVLKTVRPERLEDPAYLNMFLDEARLVATLHHQHIAQVYEVGVSDDGTYFMAMEYLHGETVRAVLEGARDRALRLPLDFGLTVITAAASGLHHAHERRDNDGKPLGIVHRDVSPSNVIIGYDGSIKLIDFGIAKAESRTTRTQTGFIKGKAGYMAPEQALGYAVDRRSDVFALGIVAYELTTQTRAFRAPSEFEAVQRIVRGELDKPSKVSPGFPQELEHVLMTALETDPDDRFQSADEFRRAIEMTAFHLGYTLGNSSVVRVLGDVCGSRPEPWLVSTGEMPAITGESAPVVMPVATRPPLPEAVIVAEPEHEDAPTVRFITVDSEPGVRPPSRVANGTNAPPLPGVPPRRRTEPRAATVPLRVTPPSRPPPMLPPVAEPFAEPFAIGSSESPSFDLSSRRRTPLVAFAVAVALVAAGVLAIFAASSGDSASAPAAASVAASGTGTASASGTASGSASASASAAPAKVAPPAALPAGTLAVHVTTEPSDATVVLDGVRLGHTPYDGTFTSAAREGWLKIRRHGYITIKKMIRLDQPVNEDIRLTAR